MSVANEPTLSGSSAPEARPKARATAGGIRELLRPFFRTQIIFGVVVIVFWILVIAFAGIIAPHDPFSAAGPRLQPPSTAYFFGTDTLGRDVFSRVLYGARLSIPLAVIAIIVSVIIGSIVGAIAGFFGGIIDIIVMRLADLTMAFPAILLAMAVTAALGPGLNHTFIAIVVVWWPIYARLIRGQVLTLREREHVTAAQAIGMGRFKILTKHVLPHSLTPVIVNATIDLGTIIILIASLSFLGLGALPPSPEWGAMITEGASNFYQWWIAAGAGLAMVSIVLAVNFLGDGLRDVMDVRGGR